MPFLARCPDCEHAQICVLDPRAEPYLRCGRCRRYYVAREPALAAVPALVQAVPAEPVSPSARTVRPSPPKITQSVEGPPAPAAAPAPVQAPPPVEFTGPSRPPVAEPVAVPGGPSPGAVVALVLLAGALIAALAGVFAFLVWGLAGGSLLAGLREVRRRYLAGQPLRLPVALACVAGGVFLAALVVPGLLGPRYRAAAESAPEPTGIQVVPLPQYAHETDRLGTEWVDASRAGLRQGRVRVEIPEVWTGPATKSSGREAGPRWLYVRVRLYRGRTGAEIAEGGVCQVPGLE